MICDESAATEPEAAAVCRQPPNASLTRMEADLSRHNATWLDRIPINLQMMVLMCRRLRLFDTAVGFFFFPVTKMCQCISPLSPSVAQQNSDSERKTKHFQTLDFELWLLLIYLKFGVFGTCVCVCVGRGGVVPGCVTSNTLWNKQKRRRMRFMWTMTCCIFKIKALFLKFPQSTLEICRRFN